MSTELSNKVLLTRGGVATWKMEKEKKIGNIPVTDELSELIDGKLTPLKDGDKIPIKGCEQFFSNKRDGSSS